jgi:release factor glutamine methyltransferase
MRVQAAYQFLIEQLSPAYGDAEARSTARMLLDDCFGTRPPFRGDLPDGASEVDLIPLVQRLLAGEPLQYLTGKAHFYGMELQVGPGVLIPRPETEELVNWALALLEHRDTGRLIDLGTGSGCIALALKRYLYDWEVEGMDVQEEALQYARSNATRLGLSVKWRQADLLDSGNWADWAPYDAILSNPPYITRAEANRMGPGVLAHEPAPALFVTNEDPLQFYRVIAEFARKKLRPGGWLLLEVNEFFGAETRDFYLEAGFHPVLLRQDMQGKDRMLGMQLNQPT